MQIAVQTALMCVASALLCVLLRSLKPEYAVLAGCAASVGVLLLALPMIGEITRVLGNIVAQADIGNTAADCLKATAVVLICDIAASVCREAGQTGLASQIELWGRVTLCAMCVPLFSDLIGSLDLLPLSF